MPAHGKVDSDFLERVVYPHLGADREEVRLGPTHGVDFGLVDVGQKALVVATDPISILPQLGFERAARFALDIVLADIAVSGLSPAYLSIEFTLPPEMSDREFERVWTEIDREASDLGTSVVTGHTARYEGCAYPWIGGATALAVGEFEEVVRPDGARPGEDVIVSTGPGVEAVGLLTTLFGDQMALPRETIEEGQERLAETDTVRDALTVATAGEVSAMHDATECGVQGALCEMAASSETKFEIEQERAPLRPGVEDICAFLDVDPWQVTSSGTILITVPPTESERVLEALESRGTPAAVIGRVAEGEGVYFDDGGVTHPQVDPSWEVYAEYAE
ncbi:hydrogenase expression protein [Halobacteriales archaeon QS_3_64_16]|nr:MAG: hydrogenase expression protein [Halobacteriales archaeon QS_3_64_16]